MNLVSRHDFGDVVKMPSCRTTVTVYEVACTPVNKFNMSTSIMDRFKA